MKALACSLLLACAPLTALPALAAGPDKAPIVIDAVVASINGKPITLVELGRRMSPPRRLTLEEAGRDPEARQTLDAMILERLIQEEAQSRRISASDEEVDSYIEEVSRRNGLSREAFEKALAAQHRSMPEYRNQVMVDILKSKLASAVLQNSVAVSDAEIDQFISDHPELSSNGPGVTLSHILVSIAGNDEAAALKKLNEAQAELQGGKDFTEVAARFSEASDAHEGGSIGFVPERELNEKIYDAIFSLKDGEVSQPVRIGDSVQIFKLEERSSKKGSESEQTREQARKAIRQQKTESKMMAYFTNDLYRSHAVDKKI